MLQIAYESEDFASDSGVTNGMAWLSFTWDELLWAAVTVGRPNRQYVFRHGLASWHEALFRLSLVRMSLEQAGPGARRLRRTMAARTLDPSEKGAVNYFLGLAVAKLFADRCLNAPWMLHLDVFRPQLNTQLSGRSRPDLIGQSVGGNWIALECKGRLSPPSLTAKQRAKEQAQRVTSINGTTPSVNAGCITFFRGDIVEFFWRDPNPERLRIPDPIDMNVSEDSWRHYYGPVLALLTEGRREERDGIVMARDERMDIAVAIDAAVMRLLEREQWAEARHTAQSMVAQRAVPSLHADGIGIMAGPTWSERFRDEGNIQ